MEFPYRLRRAACRSALIAMIVLLVCPFNAMAFRRGIANFNFDNADPVEYRARIMDFDPEGRQLVVAEHTVYVVDLIIGKRPFKTELADHDGHPAALESFEKGQLVRVLGFKDSDGKVVASLVQHLRTRHDHVKAGK